jgi:predicted phage terminase large subunit-like protein
MAESLLQLAVRRLGAQGLIDQLSPEALQALQWDWASWARPEQLAPPGDWSVWAILAGRGWGKTRTATEFIRAEVEAGRARHVALVARTSADIRDVVVGGPSGLLNIGPPHLRPRWEPSKRLLTWPNGAVALTYSAEEPDSLRGPEHDLAYADELAAWQYPDAWDQLQFGLRQGPNPRVVVSTTPRPTPLIRALIADSRTVVTRGSTRENSANLAPQFLTTITARYQGTRLGRQELDGEVLEDLAGSLWSQALIDRSRVHTVPTLTRVVIAVDPAVSNNEGSDETGIVVAGIDAQGHGYVIADHSLHASPEGWAREVARAYRLHRAGLVVCEVNNGGDLLKSLMRVVDPSLPIKAIHATRGKLLRAEPVAALYEQGRIHHVGYLPDLEQQLTGFSPTAIKSKSPDRVDAAVYAIRELIKVIDLDNTANLGPAKTVTDPYERALMERERERAEGQNREWVG